MATLSDTIEYPNCVLPTGTPEAPATWTPTESCLFTGSVLAAENVVIALPSGAVTIPQENNQLLVKLAGDARTRLIYHHADHLTGASVETDDAGTAIEVVDYYPYGSERLNSKVGRYNTPHKFTGKELDADTGLYDYGARYYDPILSRFLSIDPWSGDMTNPQTLNKYSYTLNNPVKYRDPTGKNPLLAAMAAGAIVGAAWGGAIDIGVQLYQTGSVNWGETGKSIVAGAAAGAVLGPIGEALAPTASRMVSGAVKSLFSGVDGVAGQVGKQTANSVVEGLEQPKIGDSVYRIYGGRSPPMGESWTPVNPKNLTNPRSDLGLPNGNTGRFVIEGEIKNAKNIKVQPAEPLHGNPGGAPEYKIQNAENVINVKSVKGVNPKF